jgi:hypothetical protein
MQKHPHQRRLTAQEGQSLIAVWHGRDTGQTRSAFCQEHGVGPWVLRYWLRRASIKAAPGFVEITTAPRNPVLEVAVGDALVQVRRGFDPGLLRSVVAALAAEESVSC